ncbi:MAG: Sir2 family NAD-dependent protein deacetylase, partial [Mycobacterium sp.]
PDIVYFGESVPKARVEKAYSMVDGADALLVAGSSLTVYSGYRFVRHAAARGIPVAIVNRGHTRGDDLATVKVDNGCSPILALLAGELPAFTATRSLHRDEVIGMHGGATHLGG